MSTHRPLDLLFARAKNGKHLMYKQGGSNLRLAFRTTCRAYILCHRRYPRWVGLSKIHTFDNGSIPLQRHVFVNVNVCKPLLCPHLQVLQNLGRVSLNESLLDITPSSQGSGCFTRSVDKIHALRHQAKKPRDKVGGRSGDIDVSDMLSIPA